VAAAVGIVGTLALAGCNLGAPPVTVELKDPENFDFPLSPTGIATGDVDGDGDVDVVGVGARGLAVLTNDGSGTLAIDFPSAYHPEADSPSLVDVDGDADLDLLSTVGEVWAGSDPAVPAVRHNDGTGTFGSVEPLQPGTPPGDVTSIAPADVDSDGDVDVLAALQQSPTRLLGTYINDGTGAFGPPSLVELAPVMTEYASATFVAAGDIDGDGDADAVATDVAGESTPMGDGFRTVALVAVNDGAGTFTAAATSVDVGPPSESHRAHAPVLADFDEDGSLDLAIGGGGSVTILVADGAGGFEAPRTSSLVPNPIHFVTPGDVDGDGHLDLVGLHYVYEAGTGIVAYGDGTGGFTEYHQVFSGTGLGSDGTAGRQVALADLDGDDDPDLLFLAGSLGILENVDGRPEH
jgi:hypothetical protein